MEMDKLKKFIEQEKNLVVSFFEDVKKDDILVLWGNGNHVQFYINYLLTYNIKPDYIVDKNAVAGECEKNQDILVVNADYILVNVDLTLVKFIITAPSFMGEIRKDIFHKFGDADVYAFDQWNDPLKNANIYKEYLLEHYDELKYVYDILDDKKSQDTLINVIKGRVSGNVEYFIDCYVPDQYFPDDIIHLTDHEVIVEAGSNDGETLIEIIEKTEGKFKKIICFEPNVECIENLKRIIRNYNKPIELVEKGVGKVSEKVHFKSAGTASKVVTDNDYDYMIEIVPMDEEIKEAVSYIKMDIEGLELDALKGAEQIIKKYSPTLAVCVYHKIGDIIDISKYLKELNPSYKLYLRHHTCGRGETVLYAL